MKKLAVSSLELAEILNLSDRTIDRLIAGGVIPRPTAGGRHDALAAVRAYLHHMKHDEAGRAARAEQSRATAARQRIQARKLLGELLTVPELAGVFASLTGQLWLTAQRGASLTFSDVAGQLPELVELQHRRITSIFHCHLSDWVRGARDGIRDSLDRLPVAIRADKRVDDLVRQLEEPTALERGDPDA